LVVALSGGPDSVALLDSLVALQAQFGLRIVAAHLDHGLRAESAEDAAFCARLCARLGVTLASARADVAARARAAGQGLEAAARRARRSFLRAVAAEQGGCLIALGHTCDDQAETLLLRLLRGAGRTGLAAMRPRRGGLFRPLLAASRAEVLEHLRDRGLDWRHDSSNDDPHFLRNRVRHELLPAMEARFNLQVRPSLARTAALLADEDRLLERRAGRLCRAAREAGGGGVELRLEPLRRAPLPILRRALRQALRRAGGLRGVTAVHVERMARLVRSKAASGRRVELPGSRVASFRFDRLHVGPRPAAVGPFSTELPVPGRVQLPDGRQLLARPAAAGEGPGEGAVVVAATAPLVVRTRRAGDRVLARARSLKRLLAEARVPAELRDGWPVVAAGDRVVWVPGLEQTADEGDGAGPRVRLELRQAERPLGAVSGEAR
jgi:tRNA(Ile)-lysidine synthase